MVPASLGQFRHGFLPCEDLLCAACSGVQGNLKMSQPFTMCSSFQPVFAYWTGLQKVAEEWGWLADKELCFGEKNQSN